MYSGQQWTCTSCTFKNNVSSQKCSMCNGARPAGLATGTPMGGAQGAQPPGGRLFDDLARRGQLVNGALNWPGFNALCKQIGWDDKAAATLWRQVDVDKGGSVDRREFLMFATRPDVQPYLVPFENRICGGAPAAAQMGQPTMQGGAQPGSRLFEHLVRTGQVTNGVLKWPAFLALCQAIGWDQKAATSLWNQVDVDKGGSVDRREFMTFALRPDVKQYLAAYENRVCGQGAGGPPASAGARMAPTASAPGQKLWNQLQSQGKIVNGFLSWTHFAPICTQIGWTEDVGRLLWNQTDVDKSGTLDNGEFLRFANRPDVKPYLVPFEDRTCSGPPPQDFGLRLFDYLDGKDGREQRDGVISWSEFAPLCQQAGWDPSVARMLWNDTDVDRSGTLSKPEFIKFANRPDVKPALLILEASIAAQIAAVQAQAPPGMRLFDHLDGRGQVKDGVLSWDEFAPLCAQIGWSQDIARTLWQQTDTDKSGTLSRDEFLRFAARPDVRPYLVPLEEKIIMAVVQQGGAGMPPQMGSPMGHSQGFYGQGMGTPMGGQMGPMGGQYGTMRPGQGPAPGYGPGMGGPGPAFLGQMGPQQSFHGMPPGGFGPQGPASPMGPQGYNPQMGPPPMGLGGQMGQPQMGQPQMGQPQMGQPQMGQPQMGGQPMGPGGPLSPQGPGPYNPQMGGPPPMGLNGPPGGPGQQGQPPMSPRGAQPYNPQMGAPPMLGYGMMGQSMSNLGLQGQQGQPGQGQSMMGGPGPMQGQHMMGQPMGGPGPMQGQHMMGGPMQGQPMMGGPGPMMGGPGPMQGQHMMGQGQPPMGPYQGAPPSS